MLRLIRRSRFQDQLSGIVAGHVEVAQHAPRPRRDYVRSHHQFMDSENEFNHWEIEEEKVIKRINSGTLKFPPFHSPRTMKPIMNSG